MADPPRRPSSGVIPIDAAFPDGALRELRGALNRHRDHMGARGLADKITHLRIAVIKQPWGDLAPRERLSYSGDALSLAVEAVGLELGEDVAAAALGVREALGVAGAASKDTPERVPTPPPTLPTGGGPSRG